MRCPFDMDRPIHLDDISSFVTVEFIDETSDDLLPSEVLAFKQLARGRSNKRCSAGIIELHSSQARNCFFSFTPVPNRQPFVGHISFGISKSLYNFN